MRKRELYADLCVVGGGIAGICTAISAARGGVSVVLMQDRPVLGGNASSEIRMPIGGAQGRDVRETGIVEELQLENYYYNPGMKYPLWDHVLYTKVRAEKNIRLLMNCSCFEAGVKEKRIESVTGWQLTTETFWTVRAAYYADCSGDSILAPLTGAGYMYGRESKEMFGESLGQEEADDKTMGMSILLQARETTEKKSFIPPAWAYVYEDDSMLEGKVHTLKQNFWWIELGGDRDGIHDTEEVKEELLKIAYGVWDHLKNRGDHGLDNWELEWVGSLPGKRESRRYIGDYIVTQNDVDSAGKFADVVGYGGWTMDNHYPEGFYHPGRIAVNYPAPSPWGIPLRCLYSRDIRNLTFAGRNISATHLAFSSSRVEATCGVLGEALGLAVAMAAEKGGHISGIDVEELQQRLMDQDCYLPGKTRRISPLSANAWCSSEVVRNGAERREENCWVGKNGDELEYRFDGPERIHRIRLVFDSDLNRSYLNLPSHYFLEEKRFSVPQTLIRSFTVEGTQRDGKRISMSIHENHQRLVILKVDWEVVSLRLIPEKTWGAEQFRVFAFEAE